MYAFDELQHKNDVAAVTKKLRYYEANPTEFHEAYGTPYFDLSDYKEEIAYKMRQYINDGYDPFTALIDAIEKLVCCIA